jgi:hypothetical protein
MGLIEYLRRSERGEFVCVAEKKLWEGILQEGYGKEGI